MFCVYCGSFSIYIHSPGKKARSGKTGTGKKTVLQKKYEKVKQELATFMEHKKKCEALFRKREADYQKTIAEMQRRIYLLEGL